MSLKLSIKAPTISWLSCQILRACVSDSCVRACVREWLVPACVARACVAHACALARVTRACVAVCVRAWVTRACVSDSCVGLRMRDFEHFDIIGTGFPMSGTRWFFSERFWGNCLVNPSCAAYDSYATIFRNTTQLERILINVFLINCIS